MTPINEIHGLVSSRGNSQRPQQKISAAFPSWRSKMISWGCGRLLAAKDERGLSTLEWILLVAAVGGLATMGVFIVRNATDATSDQVDGETDQVAAAKHDAAQADVLKIMRSHNYNPKRMTDECSHRKDAIRKPHFNSEGDFVGKDSPDAVMSLLDKWGDTFYFSADLSVDRNGDGQISRNQDGYCAARPLISSY